MDLVEAWLENRDFSENTMPAYRRSLTLWLAWCADNGIDPLAARFTHVNAFTGTLRGEGRAPSSIESVMGAVSSFYKFALKLEAVPRNPVEGADWPKVDSSFSPTTTFTAAQASAMWRCAAPDPVLDEECARLLWAMLVTLGARVSEYCNIDLSDLGWDGEDPVVVLRMKGGKSRKRRLSPKVHQLLTGYVGDRTSGPLFLLNGKRLDRHVIARFVQRVAKRAGLPDAEKITPHSCRHFWCTEAERAGVSLEDRQYQMGHARPETTGRYTRVNRVERDAATLMEARVLL